MNQTNSMSYTQIQADFSRKFRLEDSTYQVTIPVQPPGSSSEARRNLERKLPQFLDDLNSLLRGIQLVEHRPALPFPAALTEKDRPIFQAAAACGATHLLTGDLKDFGPFMNQLEETFGVVVQTVAEFLRVRSTAGSG